MKRARTLAILFGLMVFVLAAPCRAPADSVPTNPDFESGEPEEPPVGWHVPEVSGYRVRVSRESPNRGKQCIAVERVEGEDGGFGNVMQKFDASEFRGKRVRYRAAVRARVKNNAGTAHLWLRVDRVKAANRLSMGFFDNMTDRPITKDEWAYYEIVGDVSDDDEWINVGMFLRGAGQAWLDDVSVEIVGTNVDTTGRGRPARQLGPGLLQLDGAWEFTYRSSLLGRLSEAIGISDESSEEEGDSIDVLIPVPLCYRDQVPVSYELVAEPASAARSLQIYQDTEHNYVAKASLAFSESQKKVDLRFRSIVLVGPSSFDDVPSEAKIPQKWPAECRPWLAATWCADAEHERIQEIANEIRSDTDDALVVIEKVKRRAAEIFRGAEGHVTKLTAVQALDGRGSCTSCANLVAALLRACNVPARVLAGYPSWTGALQTHYIVEAYVPGHGWYPIESTRCESPWPNSHQVNVAIVPANYERQEMADSRCWAAGGVPYLSLNEYPGGTRNLIALGTLDRARNCDHQCQMFREMPLAAPGWNKALALARERWQAWVGSKPGGADGQLHFGPQRDEIEAKTPQELVGELSSERAGGENPE